jgi:hypothetical protein
MIKMTEELKIGDVVSLQKHNEVRKKLADMEQDITFTEATHRYTYKDKVFKSVTTVLKDYFPFDAFGVATKLSKMKSHPLYGGKTPQQILDMWGAKRDYGTARHLFAEKYIQGDHVAIKDPVDIVTKRFIDEMEFDDVIAEPIVCAPDWGLCGMIDALVCKKGKWYIYDWKTDKEIRKSAFVGGENPQCPGLLSDFDNCNFNKYTFQLGVYKLILETFYDISIEGLAVVHLNEFGATEYEVPLEEKVTKKVVDNYLESA